MKATLQNALEIENRGGAILASDWTTGRGNYITRRPIPVHCEEIPRHQLELLKGKTKATAIKLLRKHPRAQRLICVMDRRALNADVRIK